MNEKTVDYLHGKLFPMILKFSIPAAVSLLITPVPSVKQKNLFWEVSNVGCFRVSPRRRRGNTWKSSLRLWMLLRKGAFCEYDSVCGRTPAHL